MWPYVDAYHALQFVKLSKTKDYRENKINNETLTHQNKSTSSYHSETWET